MEGPIASCLVPVSPLIDKLLEGGNQPSGAWCYQHSIWHKIDSKCVWNDWMARSIAFKQSAFFFWSIPSKEESTGLRKSSFCFKSWESLNNSFPSALGRSLIFILVELDSELMSIRGRYLPTGLITTSLKLGGPIGYCVSCLCLWKANYTMLCKSSFRM